jgi:hypothetical protein
MRPILAGPGQPALATATPPGQQAISGRGRRPPSGSRRPTPPRFPLNAARSPTRSRPRTLIMTPANAQAGSGRPADKVTHQSRHRRRQMPRNSRSCISADRPGRAELDDRRAAMHVTGTDLNSTDSASIWNGLTSLHGGCHLPQGPHRVKGEHGLGSTREPTCQDRRVWMGANTVVLVLADRVLAVEGVRCARSRLAAQRVSLAHPACAG